MIFSGRGRMGGLFGGAGDGKKDALFQDLICQSTAAFWDAYLKKDAQAKGWLSEGGCAQALGDDGTLEQSAAASR